MSATKLARSAGMCAVWIGIFLASTPASAVVYKFSGICTDCGGTLASGTLVLQNYTPGTNIVGSNYVSFSYSSDLFPSFAFVGAPIAALGILPANTGAANFTLIGPSTQSSSLHPYFAFASSSGDGTWSLVGLDVGTNGIWTLSAVPDAATWTMTIGGFGAIGAAMRRRRCAVVSGGPA